MVLLTLLYLLLATVSIATQPIHACPSECTCHTANGSLHVSCTNGSLEGLPDGIPSQVVTLNVQGNNISSLNDVFPNYTELTDLDLSFNQFKGIHLQDFNKLSNLRYLNLQNNSITEIHPRAFSSLSELVTLNLANNFLESINGAIFSGLNELETLDLRGNFLCNISNKAFLDTHRLISLDLSHNFIWNLQSSVFETIGSLEKLNLAYNQIFMPDYFMGEDLINLQFVDLSHNLIEEFPNVSVPKLQYLDLSWNNISTLKGSSHLNTSSILSLVFDGNPVENITGSPFINLYSMKNLFLSHMPKLHYISEESFTGLQNLTMLNLSHNPQLSFIHQNLFLPLQSLTQLDLSYNNITTVTNPTINEQITSLDIQGNMFYCDCAIEWLVKEIQQNNSIIVNKNDIFCMMPNSTISAPLFSLKTQDLHCSEVQIVKYTESTKAKIGKSVRFICQATSYPTAEIVWITPHRKVLEYHKYHPYSVHGEFPALDDEALTKFHEVHDHHSHSSYYSESESREDRITILPDGSLFIDFVLRSDAGPYKCEAKNPRNSTSVIIKFTLDYNIINEVKIWSIIVGAICAASFFLLNLTYSLVLAGVRKCVSQRKREQIKTVIESMDQYKSAHLTRIKDNYSLQVGRIRDQYHYQLGRLREHHHNKMGRIREGASQKVERMRENYNNQLGKLKDYSSNQLVQLRGKYNNQILRIKDYGNDKFERIHEKYKLKQQHVIRLLEMMNLDNCKTVFESECVRTESMILQSDILNVDEEPPGLHSPVDSASVSDSEYVTATNSEVSSNENLYELTQINSNIPSSLVGEVETSEGKFVLNKEDDLYPTALRLAKTPKGLGQSESSMVEEETEFIDNLKDDISVASEGKFVLNKEDDLNPTALRIAKAPKRFGHSEPSMVEEETEFIDNLNVATRGDIERGIAVKQVDDHSDKSTQEITQKNSDKHGTDIHCEEGSHGHMYEHVAIDMAYDITDIQESVV